MMNGTRLLRSVTVLAALTLAVVACGGDDTVGDTLLDDTSTTLVEQTTNPTDSTDPDGTDNDISALELRAEALAAEIAAIDNDEIQASWDALEARLDEFFDKAEESTTLDEELVRSVSDELSAFDLLVEQNAAELGANFQAEWEEFFAELATTLSTS